MADRKESLGGTGQTNEIDMELELLREQLKYTKKQVNYLRISSVVSLALAAVILVFLFSLKPKLEMTLANVDEAVKQVESLKLNELDVQKIAEDVDRLVINTEENMQEATERLNSVDFESLNEAIESLNTVVSPLAALFGGR